MVDDQVPTTVSRPSISLLSKSLCKLSNDPALDVGNHAIEKIFPRLISFEEEVRMTDV